MDATNKQMAETIETYRQALVQGDLETMARIVKQAETNPALEAALNEADEAAYAAAGLPPVTQVDVLETMAHVGHRPRTKA